MIPAPIPPLTDLSVLVTRPAPHAAALCERIATLGGDAIAFPTIAIQPVASELRAVAYGLVIFTSANAVEYGLPRISIDASSRVVAIGRATAASLAAAGVTVQLTPEDSNRNSSSEDLLAALTDQLTPQGRVLIVKGVGGRELLQESLVARGLHVDTLEVYQRGLPTITPALLTSIEDRWATEGIDIVTLTSGEILINLDALLSERGKASLRVTAFLTVSERVARIARDFGLQGECLIAPRPDEDAMIGALIGWHTRARIARAN